MSKTLRAKHIFVIIAVAFFQFISFHEIDAQSLGNGTNSQDAAAALGFVYGVELALENISKMYPELKQLAAKKWLNFKIAHKSAIDSLETVIVSRVGDFKSEMKTELRRLQAENPSPFLIDFKQARDYLSSFDSDVINGRNILYQDYVETLLRYNPVFVSQPYLEFQKGFRKKYTTNGQPKAKGLEVEFEIPKSWRIKEGKRPNVTQILNSADGQCSIMVSIASVEDEMKKSGKALTKEDIEALKTKEFETELLNQVSLIENLQHWITSLGFESTSRAETKEIVIDGQPGYQLIVEGVNPKLGTISLMIIHQVVFADYTIMSIAHLNSIQDAIEETKRKYQALALAIMHGMVITSKWH